MNGAFPVEGLIDRIYFRQARLRNSRATRIMQPSSFVRLIGNAAGVQFTPLSIFQTHAAVSNREHSRPSLRRIDRRTPLPYRGGRCRERPLARLYRPEPGGPDRADALLRTDARRSRQTAAPVAGSRARTRFRGNGQGCSRRREPTGTGVSCAQTISTCATRRKRNARSTSG